MIDKETVNAICAMIECPLEIDDMRRIEGRENLIRELKNFCIRKFVAWDDSDPGLNGMMADGQILPNPDWDALVEIAWKMHDCPPPRLLSTMEETSG